MKKSLKLASLSVGNPALAQAMREKRRSNAAGSHDSRPHRQRSRSARRAVAIKEAE